ncbi:MAG: lytic transglycosylase [Pseudorhodobacter sp. PARRP1]|nr:MAG: lytic transglycosylase [Pseudorhodobacter sp. PARRP1]
MRVTFLLGAAFSVFFLGLVPAAMAEVLPKMRWDHVPEAANWTNAALVSVEKYDSKLAARVPGDIETWCPGYKTASMDDRRAFWVGVMSAVAKYESGYNARAAGAGRYYGLMQISTQTANAYACEANTGSELKSGAANLDCAVKIIARQVGRDGMVSGKGNRGVARDWGPMSKSRVRADIAAWTAKQAYCAG